MTDNFSSIETPRLILRLLSADALAALVARDRAAASLAAGCGLGDFPDEEIGIAEWRLKDLQQDPLYLPWSLRVMALKPDLTFVGHFNFHTRPDPDYLRELSPRSVEFGYFVMPAHRRQGLAQEAATAMMDWAAKAEGISRFVVSVSPENAPSVAMVRKMGFGLIGSHVDDEDGYEEILARNWPNP